MRFRLFLLAATSWATIAAAQTTTPVTTPDATAAIAMLRDDLIDSFNQGDLPRLLSHLDDDVVVTWQNGEVCRGPDEVKRYYDKMMTGPDRRVQRVHAEPKVTDRHVYGDWAVSWGEMNDHFVLTDGTDLDFGSRFTATTAKRGEVWKVTSFHASVNAFDNAILSYAQKRVGLIAAAVTGVAGLIVGLAIGLLKKRKPA